MRISLKVGSVLHLPFSGTFLVRSSNPAYLKIEQTPQGLTITAVAVGATSVLLALGGDFTANLLVDVVAA